MSSSASCVPFARNMSAYRNGSDSPSPAAPRPLPLKALFVAISALTTGSDAQVCPSCASIVGDVPRSQCVLNVHSAFQASSAASRLFNGKQFDWLTTSNWNRVKAECCRDTGCRNAIEFYSSPACRAVKDDFDVMFHHHSLTCGTQTAQYPCGGVHCGSHGSCSGGSCHCTSGYSGTHCEHNPCHGVNCGSHGNCHVSGSSAHCTCSSGAYSGDRCQNFDACYNVDCGSHGTCSGGQCTCSSGAYTGDRCQNFDPCFWNEAECDEPHPAAVCTHPAPLPVERRNCTNPTLPTPNWGATELGGPLTPADEYPSVRDVCTAGLQTLETRTRHWLERAEDYLMHGANDQAGTIAAELCAESNFQTLTCLNTGSSSADILGEMHTEACNLADVTHRSALAREVLEVNEVRPLSFTMYERLYDGFADELEQDVLRHDVEAAALRVMGQLETDIQTAAANAARNRAQNAVDEAGWYTQQDTQNQHMASGYAASIREVESNIQATKQTLMIDEQQLESRLSSALQGARDAFSNDINNADAEAKKQMVVDAGKSIFSIGLAVLSGPIATLSAIKDSASTLAGDVFDYFRCSATAIHVYDSINSHLGGVNSALSSHGLGTINAYDIGSCDLDHLDCGHLDHDACDADKATITNALEQLSDFQAFIASLDGLAQLSNIVLDPSADVSATDLPHVALLRSSLGVIDASTSIQLFTDAAALGDVAEDVNQLVSLLTSKLDMLGNFYKAKIASQNAAVRQQMFVRQAARARALAADTAAGSNGNAEQSAALESYWERHMLDRCYVALLYFAQQSQAFQFIALQKNHNLASVLKQLQGRKHTADEFRTLLVSAHSQLTLQWESVLSNSNNCGGGCWSVIDFQLADLPGNSFATDNALTISIDIPPNTGYGHVTFSDVRVYLVGADGPATIEFSKRGSSQVLDNDGAIWSFTHMATDPPYRFGYEPDSCEATTRPLGGSNGNNLCDLHSVYVKYPPYGVWDVRVVNGANLDLAAVTTVRFSFLLSTVPLDASLVPASDGVTVFAGARNDGQGTCTTVANAGDCRSQTPVTPPAAPPPSQPMAPVTPVTPTAPNCGQDFYDSGLQQLQTACPGAPAVQVCTNDPRDLCRNFLSRFYPACASRLDSGPWAAYNDACNQAATAPPPPSTTPVRPVPAVPPVRTPVAPAAPPPAALPPVTPPPVALPPPAQSSVPAPCQTYPEFMSYSRAVTAACCDDTNPCDTITGLPTVCTSLCAALLIPMQTACDAFLASIEMQTAVNTVAAQCPAAEPCESYPQFLALSQIVTKACCSDSAAACVSGLPTAVCSTACARAVLPMQAACNDFLDVIGMRAATDEAAGNCRSMLGNATNTVGSESNAAAYNSRRANTTWEDPVGLASACYQQSLPLANHIADHDNTSSHSLDRNCYPGFVLTAIVAVFALCVLCKCCAKCVKVQGVKDEPWQLLRDDISSNPIHTSHPADYSPPVLESRPAIQPTKKSSTVCTSCGAVKDASARFCQECGAA